MASFSSTYPSQRPVFTLDAANAGRLDPRCSFSRASTANVWDGSKHLSSENLFAYSSPPTGWTLDSFTLTSGQTAPDGSTNAVKLTEDTSGSEHRIYPYSNVTTSGGATTLSGYFKYIGRQWVMFRLNDGTNYRRVWFDIQNGALGSAETGITHSITASGNGYYKCVATIATSNTSYLPTIGGAPANTGITYTGSGADAFYVWGLQYNHNVGSVLSETSGQIHREYAPTLVSKANNVGRFDHTTDGQSVAKGILIEGAATNAIGYSDSLANWDSERLTAANASAVGPTGNLNAALLTPSTDVDLTHDISTASVTTSVTGTVTLSGYFKAAGYDYVTLGIGNRSPGNFSQALFSLSTGAYITNSSGGSNSYISSSTEYVGNGWWRLVATFSTSRSNEKLVIAPAPNASPSFSSFWGTPTYTGDGYSSVLATGIQAEIGKSFASSLITSNSGAETTRAAESLSVATADIGYTGGPVSIVAEGEGGRGDYPRLFSMGGLSSYLTFFRYSSAASASTAYKFWVYDSGTQQADLNEEASVTRVAVSIDTNSVKSCGNGGTVQSDTAAVMPVLSTTLQIGDQPTGGKQWNGHCKRIAIYNEALSDSNLQAVTS